VIITEKGSVIWIYVGGFPVTICFILLSWESSWTSLKLDQHVYSNDRNYRQKRWGKSPQNAE